MATPRDVQRTRAALVAIAVGRVLRGHPGNIRVGDAHPTG